MIEPDATILKGTHHISSYSLHVAWSPGPERMEYDPIYDGLVINEDNIEAVSHRIRLSLGNQEPVIVALFVPKRHKNITSTKRPSANHKRTPVPSGASIDRRPRRG